MFRSIRWRLTLSFAAIAMLAAVVLGAVLLAILQDYYSKQEQDYLRGNGKAIAASLEQMLSNGEAMDTLPKQASTFSFIAQTRIRLYDASNQIVWDSGVPERINVMFGLLEQKVNVQAPFSDTLPLVEYQSIITLRDPASKANDGSVASKPRDREAAIVAQKAVIGAQERNESALIQAKKEGLPATIISSMTVPVVGTQFGFGLNPDARVDGRRSNQTAFVKLSDGSGNVIGSVELSDGPSYGLGILDSVAVGWGLASAVAVVLAAVAGWVISRRISAPVLALTTVTARMAGGDLTARANVRGQDELARLGRSYNDMASQVQDTVGALRRFVSDAAHELHTPLTALRANLDLAADETAGSPQSAFLDHAQAMVVRMESLTNDLLDLSRLEAAPERQAAANVDVAGIVRERAEAYASQAEQAGLTFQLDMAPDAARICAEEVHVVRVLDNLIDNACKFTPAPGCISVCLGRENGQVVLSVSDSGIGIPAQDLPHLFNRFHRGRNATPYPGSGLGLAIVKAIVDQQAGSVSAESSGSGSRFTVRWPEV